MQFERSKACNYSAHVFLPILFGVCAGIIIVGSGFWYTFAASATGMTHNASTRTSTSCLFLLLLLIINNTVKNIASIKASSSITTLSITI